MAGETDIAGFDRIGDCVNVERSYAGHFIDATGTWALAAEKLEGQLVNGSVGPMDFDRLLVAEHSDVCGCWSHCR